MTEGTESAWERARYDWDPSGDEVTVTTLDSKVFGPGGGWVFKMPPDGEGTRVAGPVFRKSFKNPLKTV